MKNDRPATSVVDVEHNLYPHFKITAEAFPRVLATRIVEEDGAEYFGPFLPRTSVRILIDFLNRTFRLRLCDLDIDGSFPVPCTMYYRKRCLAPCVAGLYDRAAYSNNVALARIFLTNERGKLRRLLLDSIEAAAANLDFETAADRRDMLVAIEKWWGDQRLNVWLDDAIDTLATEDVDDGSALYLVTQRNKFTLGRKVFTLPATQDEALYEVTTTFYQVSLPREIRVYREFDGRRSADALLTERFGRPVAIKVIRNIDQRITARRALHNTRAENEVDRVKYRPGPDEIAGELQRIFALARPPRRVEAFDVAHLSGSNFAAARSVWDSGRFVSADFGFDISGEQSEVAAIARAVRDRLLSRLAPPDLIILDGGKPQLRAVSAVLEKEFGEVGIPLVGAVKPRGRHSAVSHFLLQGGKEIGFDPDNPAHSMLQLLRDEAHDLSNRVHRDLRDMAHFYELAAVLPSSTEAERRRMIARAGTIKNLLELNGDELREIFDGGSADRIESDLGSYRSAPPENIRPLIVPIRFVAENGNADDLVPIEFR